MKYYNVCVTINIPVSVKNDGDEVDAYYEARDQWHEFSLNEADIKVTSLSESAYKEAKAVVVKLHSNTHE